MKKKLFKILATVFTCSTLILGLSACNKEHTHSYVDTIIAPTCTEQGYTAHVCECKDSYFDTYVEALGHDFTNYVFDNNATVEADGTKTAVCNRKGCNETDTITVEGTKLDNGIVFTSLLVEALHAYSTVSNATTEFSFVNEIKVYGNAQFFVAKDKYGSQTYLTKTVPLEEGDNVFYVFEMVDNELIKTYTVTLRRRPMYTVSFEGNIPSQRVEEGQTANLPTEIPKKGAYIFTAWNFDFSTPITGDITITATWQLTTEKILILDASASMRTENNGETRFERAIENIRTIALDCFQKGIPVSLILANSQPYFIAERYSSNEEGLFYSLLDELLAHDTSCSYTSADIKSSIALTESILNENTSTEILLFTGTEYTNSENVTIVNVAEEGEWNAAILNATANIVENYYTFEIDLACYGRDTDIQVNIDFYGANDEYSRRGYTTTVRCQQNQEIRLILINEELYNESTFNHENIVYFLLSSYESIFSFEYANIFIDESDSFAYDNSFFLYGGYKQAVKTQYASSNPNVFISSSLAHIRSTVQDSWDMQITEIKRSDEPNLDGYDFYLFESMALTVLPEDGVIFLINPSTSLEGFTLGETVSGSFALSFDSTHPITKTISSTNVRVSSYTKFSSYDSSFTPIMWCGDDPVCLVKNTSWEKIIILAFNMQNSNIAIDVAFPMFMYNTFNYFFPKTIEKTAFDVGEDVKINSANENVHLFGYETYIEYTQFPSTFIPNMPGTYTVRQTMTSGRELSEKFFVKIPREESNIFQTKVLPIPNRVVANVTVQETKTCSIAKVEPTKQRIEINQLTQLKIFVNSSFEGVATLTLYDNECVEKSIEIELIKGSQIIELDYVFSSYGLHELTFDIIKSNGSQLLKNSNFKLSINILTEENILILERNAHESDELVRLLSENDHYHITVLNILTDNIPMTVENLSVYSQVILVNIANADMPDDFDGVLQSYVYDFGGSLFTVGGNDENGETNAYNQKDMYGTLYQEMLPVQAINYTPPMGVVFIIDTSGSMLVTGDNGISYFDNARQSLAAGLDSLSERDYVGIVALGSNANVILPMTARTQESAILSAISTLEANGGDTIYSTAIKTASQMLLACDDLAIRHIIMITDGYAGDRQDEYIPIIKDYYERYGVTLSIMGMGLYTGDSSYALLENIVETGHGRLYNANGYKLFNIMCEELYTSARREIEYGSFELKIHDEYMYNISVYGLTLDGFYGTRLKAGATAIITGIYDVPIYAQWNYGKGIVGSFMSDLNGTFSQDLLSGANGVALLNQIISGAFSKSNVEMDSACAEEAPPSTSTAFTVALQNGETLELTLEDENHCVVQTIILDENANLEKELQFIVPKTGRYLLKYVKKDISGNIMEEISITLSL